MSSPFKSSRIDAFGGWSPYTFFFTSGCDVGGEPHLVAVLVGKEGVVMMVIMMSIISCAFYMYCKEQPLVITS